MLKGKAKKLYMRTYMRRWRAQRPAKPPPEPSKPEPRVSDNLSLLGERCLICDSGRILVPVGPTYCLCKTCITEANARLAELRQ